MPYSIVLIDLQNNMDLKKLSHDLKGAGVNSFEFVYCSSIKKQANYKLYKNFVFDQKENIEKIINSVTCECRFNNIIIVRNSNMLGGILNLIAKHTKSNQIIYAKRKMSALKHLWFKIQKFVGSIFAHNILPIDYGVVLYGEIPSKVLKSITSPAILTKTNMWEGIELIDIAGGDKYNFPYNKLKCAFFTLIPLVLLVLLLVIDLCLNLKLFIIFKILYYGFIFALLILAIMYGLKWILYSTVGENISDKAKTLD